MKTMPRPRPLGLCRQVTRHGTVCWYVRVGKGPRIRLRAPYDSKEFWEQYRDALAGKAPSGPKTRLADGSLAWLIDQYQKAAAFRNLAPSTRRARGNVMRRLAAKSGAKPFREIRAKDILASRDSLAGTPETANIMIKTLRQLFDYAIAIERMEHNPARSVKLFPGSEDGFPTWTDDDLLAFERRWPLGTRERLAFDLLLYTGLRRSDAVRLGRQHVKDGFLSIRTAKTGTQVTLPLLAPLAASIEATRTGDLAFIVGERGRPMNKDAFGNWFGEACRKAGIRKSAHGLRKAGATRAVENDATTNQLMAMFGWESSRQAEKYTRAADRKKMGMAAGMKLLAAKG